MYPGKDDEFYLKETIKVWGRASEDQKAQFRIKYRREIEIVSIENDLRAAIRAGDTGEAERRLDELTERNPEHGTLGPAKVMVKAMDTAHPHEPAAALTYLDILEREWTPAGKTIFGSEAKALLAPFWRTAGQALENMVFDPEHPDRHASRAYLECGDWEAVIRVVQSEAGFENQPVLLGRMAEAHWQNKQERQAVKHWFELCWLDQRYFEGLIEGGHIPVSWLVEYWNEAMDVDIEPHEPDISVEWFPAWVLLRDSRWAHSVESRGAEVGPQRAFDLVRGLMVGDDDQLALRAELRNIHPALFHFYMDEIRAREG